MLSVEFCDQKKSLSSKPNSFTDYCEEIEKLFSVKDVKNMIHKYIDDSGKFQSLDVFTYPDFFVKLNVKEIKIFLTEEDSKFFEEAGLTNVKEENKNTEKEETINTNTTQEEKNINQSPEIVITKEQVIARIVAQQKSKIHESKLKLAKEKKLKEKEKKNAKDKKKKPEDKLNTEINKILTEKLAQLKTDLINESNLRVSQILSQSTIKKVENMVKEEKNNKKNEIDSVEIHTGICCSSCGIYPIVGKRYHCVYCDDIDYCEKCEEKIGDIHDHPLYILRYKID